MFAADSGLMMYFLRERLGGELRMVNARRVVLGLRGVHLWTLACASVERRGISIPRWLPRGKVRVPIRV